MNNNKNTGKLLPDQTAGLIKILKDRFEKNMSRHKELDWNKIHDKLISDPAKLWSLNEMERTGGEPDVIGYDKLADEYLYYDCSAETPAGRRNVCYDRKALDSRKTFKPENSAADMAAAMGVDLLTEEEYRDLQGTGDFDTKTSSWLKTPEDVRMRGGALFGDRRFGRVFIYHNGAESYYASRAFRGSIRI